MRKYLIGFFLILASLVVSKAFIQERTVVTFKAEKSLNKETTKCILAKHNKPIKPTLGRMGPSINFTSYSIPKITSLLNRRIAKIYYYGIDYLYFGFQSSLGIKTTPKTIFSIYPSFLSITIPDPRVYILSSRAHPPTLLS